MATKPEERKQNPGERSTHEHGKHEQGKHGQGKQEQHGGDKNPQEQGRGFEESQKPADEACEPCGTGEQQGTRRDDKAHRDDKAKHQANVDKDEQAMQKAQPVADDL